jgi:peptide/nickel transport system substrate-binding protein
VSSVDELPIGTVTFLFTDIEGSTQLLRLLGGELYGRALDEHRQILRQAFAEHDGHEIDTQGDSFFVAFRRAKDAVATAITCQRRLAEHAWPEAAQLSVRMGIHTGEPAIGGERYVGMGVHRAARICAAGHGGQVLISQTTRELLRDDPITNVTVRDLGEHQLKDMDEPERVYQLVAPGLPQDFPALKTAAQPPFEGREGELAEAASEELARRWRRPARRTLLIATFAAAAVGVTAGVLLTHGGGSTAGAGITADAVGLIDSDTGKLVSEIPAGSAPAEVAVGANAVWVTNTNDNTVSRIDLATRTLRQTIPVGAGPEGVAVGGGDLWVANGLDGTVSRIDPATNREVDRVFTGNGPRGVAYGEGSVWVTNSVDGTVTRIDPNGARAPQTFPAVIGAAGVAVGFGRVWIASPPTASVIALDPRTGQVLQSIPVGGEPSAIAVGGNVVWVANRADGTVSRINPRTSKVIGVGQVGPEPEAIGATRGEAWVANGGDRTLVRVDSSGRGVGTTVSLQNPPSGLAVAGHGVYVAVQSSSLEHRGGEERVLVDEPVSSIDPTSFDTYAIQVLSMTNDGLVGFRRVAGGGGVQLVPDLAVSVPAPTDAGKTYTFQVRAGVHYSDGTLVQPEDFKRAIERALALGQKSEFPAFGNIIGANRCTARRPCKLDAGIVVDRRTRTVTFKLRKPDPELPPALASPGAFAVPPGTPAHDIGDHPIPATGPYRIATFDKKGKRIRLVRNERFTEWSRDAQPDGYPNAISLSWAQLDPARRLAEVERGRADAAIGFSPSSGYPPLSKSQVRQLAVSYPSQLHLDAQLATSQFFLNTRVPPFNDVRARRAVNLAFDRQAFTRSLGPAFQPTCRLVPPNMPGYRPFCVYGSGGVRALTAARRLVGDSGTRGARVDVWIFRAAAAYGPYMVSVLDLLGYRARLKVVGDENRYFSAVFNPRTRAQIGYVTWAYWAASAPDFLRQDYSCAARNSSLSGFCSPSVDAQMAHAAAVQVEDPPAGAVL